MKRLKEILKQLEEGELNTSSAEIAILEEAKLSTDVDLRIDLDRAKRCGFPEVVYSEGKSPEVVVKAFQTLYNANQNCLATRVSKEHADSIINEFSEAQWNEHARTVTLMTEACKNEKKVGRVLVVTAGTTDRPVAEETLETLRWMQVSCDLVCDVGVAGPQRILEHVETFQECDAIVVVAGMEGALPSVVGGWVNCPVIAVPTSVGYGASFNGIAALLSMLNSCAANISVVNIDAGFKGGFVAGLIAKRRHDELS